jgi:hypothetical protein
MILHPAGFGFAQRGSSGSYTPLIVAGFALLAAYLLTSGSRERVRRKTLAHFAAREGFHYSPRKRKDIQRVYPGFELFGQGRRCIGENFLTGSRDNCGVTAFDFSFQTGAGHSVEQYHCAVIILESPFPLRTLNMRPENAWDTLSSVFGSDDIDFESEEFSHRFHISSPDRHWAGKVLNPHTIEFLLKCGDLTLHMHDRWLMIPVSGRLEPQTILWAISTGTTVLEGIPEDARMAA